MSRSLSTVVAATIGAKVVEPFFAIDLMFTSGPLYLWTGVGSTTIAAKSYVGSGNLLNISEVSETSEIAATGATITLAGVPSALLALALTEPYQGRVCRIYFGVVGSTTEYTELFTGYMDQMTIEEGPEYCTIQLSVESRLIDLERSRVRRYTNNDQKTRFPLDKGLEFVESLQDKPIYWGAKAP